MTCHIFHWVEQFNWCQSAWTYMGASIVQWQCAGLLINRFDQKTYLRLSMFHFGLKMPSSCHKHYTATNQQSLSDRQYLQIIHFTIAGVQSVRSWWDGRDPTRADRCDEEGVPSTTTDQWEPIRVLHVQSQDQPPCGTLSLSRKSVISLTLDQFYYNVTFEYTRTSLVGSTLVMIENCNLGINLVNSFICCYCQQVLSKH